jgi:hypothetical protein
VRPAFPCPVSRHIFSGHWHKNGVAKSERYDVENVVTSAVGLQLGPDQPGFRLVKVFQVCTVSTICFCRNRQRPVDCLVVVHLI